MTPMSAMPLAGRSRAARPLAQLYMYRELIWVLAWRDIRVRYKHSMLGAVWAVLLRGTFEAALEVIPSTVNVGLVVLYRATGVLNIAFGAVGAA